MVAARPIAVLTVAVLAGLASAGAGAATAADHAAPAPWATINVCDTDDHPDAIGVRGSMPGTGERGDALSMRIQLQYLRRRDGRWLRVGRAGDSGLLDLGHGDARTRQAGRTFTIEGPDEGRPAFVLRAVVTFEWRRDGDVLRRARRITSAGHGDTPGADPEGYSAASCAIR